MRLDKQISAFTFMSVWHFFCVIGAIQLLFCLFDTFYMTKSTIFQLPSGSNFSVWFWRRFLRFLLVYCWVFGLKDGPIFDKNIWFEGFNSLKRFLFWKCENPVSYIWIPLDCTILHKDRIVSPLYQKRSNTEVSGHLFA